MKAFFEPMEPDHSARATVEALCHGALTSVKLAALYPAGRCYWNSDDYVKRFGGKVCHGWLVMVRSGHLVEALHHALVELADGSLIDVTQYPYSPAPSTISFVRDERLKPPRDVPKFIKSKFIVLNGSVGGELLKKVSWRQSEINARLFELAALGGQKNMVGKQMSLKRTPETVSLLDELEWTKGEVDRALRLMS